MYQKGIAKVSLQVSLWDWRRQKSASHKLTQPMDPEKKSLNFIFPTKYVIPKSLSRLAIGQVSKDSFINTFAGFSYINMYRYTVT